jgi:hypothetical protein
MMGFRSTLITEDRPIVWPDWFREKWDRWLHFTGWYHGCLATKGENKWYAQLAHLTEDIRRALNEQPEHGRNRCVLVTLHECGGVSRCAIDTEKIVWTEPQEWAEVESPSHWYCYGCSDKKEGG